MVYHWLVRRRIHAAWGLLSDQKIDSIPMAQHLRFTFIGEHALAAELHSADELRAWLRRLFELLPDLRFVVDDVVVEGPPWSLHAATRYRAVQGERTLYQGAQFTRVKWGRLAEEFIVPDTQAVARVAPAIESQSSNE
jgi:predicted ester cyclase